MGEQRRFAKSALARTTRPPPRPRPTASRNSVSSPPSVSGTSAGRGSTTFRPNRRATIIGKTGRAHLRDRRPAGGDHQRGRGGVWGPIIDAEQPVGMVDFADRIAAVTSRPRRARIRASSIATICRAEPSQNNCPSVFSCQAMRCASTSAMKSGRRVARQRRLREMRVGRQETVGRGVQIGEIAPPAARNQDFLARLVGMVDAAAPAARAARQSPPPSAPPRPRRGRSRHRRWAGGQARPSAAL